MFSVINLFRFKKRLNRIECSQLFLSLGLHFLLINQIAWLLSFIRIDSIRIISGFVLPFLFVFTFFLHCYIIIIIIIFTFFDLIQSAVRLNEWRCMWVYVDRFFGKLFHEMLQETNPFLAHTNTGREVKLPNSELWSKLFD